MPPSRPVVVEVSDDARDDVVDPSAAVSCVEEVVFVADKENGIDPLGEFDVEKDCILFASADNARRVRVAPDSYLVLYPSDAHMPCMAVGEESQPVRKVCVKVPYMA